MELWLYESNYSPKNLREISELGLDRWINKKSDEMITKAEQVNQSAD